MTATTMAPHAIRELDPTAEGEIEWVARGMRRTLVEVEGEAVGTALYTMDWLRDRVRFHLDRSRSEAAVYVAVAPDGELVGHTIVRVEHDERGRFGLFSTTYVDPASRRRAIAGRLLETGERWMAARDLPESATWTSATNAPLLRLYEKHGYAETERATHATTATVMVRLAKRLR